MQLGEIFNSEDLGVVTNLLNAQNFTELKKFLHSKSQELARLGILADYLYYYLEYQFRSMTHEN
jgi:hypothetical protein